MSGAAAQAGDVTPGPSIPCSRCGHLMQDFGFKVCFTCTYGREASNSSVVARERIELERKRRR